MSISRRKFMLIAGGGVLLAAGSSLATFVSTRTPHKALKPWQMAGVAYSEPRQRALSYALLAPNPHNRQPWIADLGTSRTVILRADTQRLLKETDPFDRQITIGLGCFLELMIQAANADGYRVELELFPQGVDEKALDQRPIAIARFEKDETLRPEPLFNWVHQRRSTKEPFDLRRKVRDETLAELRAAIGDVTPDTSVRTSNTTAQIEALRELTWLAFETEYRTPAKLQESIDLMRMGKVEIETNPDGIDLGGGFLESLMITGMLNRESLADPNSSSYSQGLEMYREVCNTAMGYVWLTTRTNSRVEQIAAGRAWVRINLAATAAGIGIHPLSQALQEYPEMKTYYNQVHKLLAADGGTVQMLGRLGYCKEVPPSPRWALEHKIINA